MHLSPPINEIFAKKRDFVLLEEKWYGSSCCISGTKYGPVRKDVTEMRKSRFNATSCFFTGVPSFGAHDEAMRQRGILAIRDDPCEHLEFQCDAPIEWKVKGNGGSCDKNDKHCGYCQWMGEHVK